MFISIFFNLQPNCVDFEESRWYKSLSFYGFRVEPEIGNGDDPDLKLLPNIIDKILIPKLSGLSRYLCLL